MSSPVNNNKSRTFLMSNSERRLNKKTDPENQESLTNHINVRNRRPKNSSFNENGCASSPKNLFNGMNSSAYSLPRNYGGINNAITSSSWNPNTQLNHTSSNSNTHNGANHPQSSLLDGLRFHSDVDNFSESNYEFDDSHPSSSDNDSDGDSSLDDVCLPMNVDVSPATKNWPDLQVLQDFYDEEIKETMIALNEASTNLQSETDYSTVDEDNDENVLSKDENSKMVGFQFPLISKIDTPASLATKKVNEAEAIKGRLRPPRFSPWDKSIKQNLKRYLPNELAQNNEQTPLIDLKNGELPLNSQTLNALNNTNFINANAGPIIGEKKFQQFRYTYFRPNLDSTIHSPSISGLLQDGQTFGDLFVVSQYQKTKLPPSIIKENKSKSGLAATIISNGSSSITQNNSSKEGTSTPRSAILANNEIKSEDPIPFWLDVLDPTEEEMKVLSKSFGIHPLTTEDIFLNEAREKVELFKDYYFVCFRSFDIVQERLKRKALNEKLSNLENLNLEEMIEENQKDNRFDHLKDAVSNIFNRKDKRFNSNDNIDYETGPNDFNTSKMTKKQREVAINNLKQQIKRQKSKHRDLQPLNFYIIVFHEGVITFHFSPTPHPVTVRRRARLLKDYLTVSSDWIAYALIDDITDSFGPMIETIEDEVYAFEDAILKLHSGENSDSDDSDEEIDDNFSIYNSDTKTVSSGISSNSSSSYLSTSSAEWQRKGVMLRRIGECRKRIMSLLRLLGSKADVIKGLAKRCNESFDVAPRSEIGMYLGDIQDHIITMVQGLNHYEKLLARSHSNYLAQINIDMTKVNNDMNDVLGKISILGTLVLPMNVVTGLWGMNVIVPGQEHEGLIWFFGILVSMFCIAAATYFITVKIYNF